MNRGFVIEQQLTQCCDAPKTVAIPSQVYGEIVFHDLTEGMSVGQCDKRPDGLDEGRCPKCDAEIEYKRWFVVTEGGAA